MITIKQIKISITGDGQIGGTEMTPKEALNNMIDEHNSLLGKYKLRGGFGNWQIVVRKALTELEELKRYPTADEVCEALHKSFGYQFEYIEVDVERLRQHLFCAKSQSPFQRNSYNYTPFMWLYEKTFVLMMT